MIPIYRAYRKLYLEVADGQPRVLLGHLLDEGGEVGVRVGAQDEDLKC